MVGVVMRVSTDRQRVIGRLVTPRDGMCSDMIPRYVPCP